MKGALLEEYGELIDLGRLELEREMGRRLTELRRAQGRNPNHSSQPAGLECAHSCVAELFFPSLTHLSPGESSQSGQLGSQVHPSAVLWRGEVDLVSGGIL